MAKPTKKRWFIIHAPDFFQAGYVGETPAAEAKDMIGKTLKANMAAITGDMRKQNINIDLLIESVLGDTAKTKMIGLNVIPNSIKRMVRKGRTRLDIVIKTTIKDGQVVTIKLFLLARSLIKGSAYSTLENEAKRVIVKLVSNMEYNELCQAVLDGAIEKELKARLHKIYPLKSCMIKVFKLERFIKAVDLRKVKSEMVKTKKKTARKEEDEELPEGEAKAEEPETEEKKEEVTEEGTG